MSGAENLHVPYDLYESPQEIVLFMPLGGVDKNSLSLTIEDYRLVIRGTRNGPALKHDLVPLKEECFWGDLEQIVDLPPQIYFDKIHSKLTPENILQVIIPKALVPEKIKLEVERGG